MLAPVSTMVQFGMGFSTVQRTVLYNSSSKLSLSFYRDTRIVNNELQDLIQRRINEMSGFLISDLLY